MIEKRPTERGKTTIFLWIGLVNTLCKVSTSFLDDQVRSESEFGEFQRACRKQGYEFPQYYPFPSSAVLPALSSSSPQLLARRARRRRFIFSRAPWLMTCCAHSDAAALTRCFLEASFVRNIPRIVTAQGSQGNQYPGSS